MADGRLGGLRMFRGKCLLPVASLVVIASPTMAQGRAVYFHKADVGRAAFTADAAECESLAAGVQAPSIQQPYAGNIYAAGTAAFLSGFMRSRGRRGMIDNVLRTCMADKGYRRIEASEAVDQAIDAASGAERLERLAVLAAAAEPQGKVLPR